MTTKQEMGASLTALREKKGRPSYRSIARALAEVLGVYAPSDQTISNWHKGLVSPETADLVIAGALADYYGTHLSAIHPVLAERLGSALDLLNRWSGCTREVAA